MLFSSILNKYYAKYLLLYIIGIIALVAVDYLQLILPEALSTIVGILENSEKYGTAVDTVRISNIIINVLFVGIGMFLGRVLWRFTIFNASHHIESDVRHDMFLKSERLSVRYYHENKVGNIMSWFTTDLESVEEFIGWGTIMFVDAFFLGALVLVKLFMLDWALTLLFLIPLLLLIVWGALVEKFMSAKWEYRQKCQDELYDFSQESFTGIRVIKAFVKENVEIHHFAKIARKNKDANISFARLSIIFDIIIEILLGFVFAFILGFGGYCVYCTVTNSSFVLFGKTIDFNTEKLVLFFGYYDSLIWPMIAMGQIVSMYSRASASLKRIKHFLDAPEEITTADGYINLENVSGSITFNSFSFEYPDGGGMVLDNINLKINAGESVGIVGRIGSGKTTLVNSLLRLYNVEKGSIFIDDKDIMDCTIKSVRDSIAYVPQDNFLFSDKIKNNIAFSNGNMDMDKIKKAATFADVDDNIMGFKDRYDTVSGERGVTLSGGQKQRISIARAYAKNAPIMILDDSVSAVDLKTEETILDNIREWRTGKTTIVIASRVSTVANLSRIIVINDGKIEAFDNHENLLKISPTYAKMVSLQKLEAEVNGGDA